MKKTLLFFILSLITVYIHSQSAVTPVAKNERLSLDKGWKFHLGDIPFPVIKGHSETYASTKAGYALGAAAPGYDDTDWQDVTLPHDWSVALPFDADENLSQNFKKRGYGWYRRIFRLDPSDRGKNIELQFDGIATHATVWVNGIEVHHNWCGYTSSYIDVTPLMQYGDAVNTIAIRVDAVAQEGWWYEGAGIYRHTWLVKRSPVHIITDGVYANPVKTSGKWIIPAEVTLYNCSKSDAPDIDITIQLIDEDGKIATRKSMTLKSKLFDRTVAHLDIPVEAPRLWSVDSPYLYTVRTELRQHGALLDEQVTHCGFRTLRFDKDTGFYLNDKLLKIKGVCNHGDHAGVGTAVPNSLWEFRLRKLKEMGSNAYRCAHNPPAREFLEACDSIGILVMDENRLFNSSPEYLRQLEWMIRRDRNHPSVFMWSVFNEEPMQGTEIGYEMVRLMSAEVKKLDTTRPVTAAMNGGLFSKVNVSQVADVVGLNYQQQYYDRFHNENPDMCMTSSEDVSGLMQRGQYVTDKGKNLLDCYDTQHPGWGTTHRESWRLINERPFLAGCFVWTGFDYRGEPTPFKWPTVSSNFGIMDLCGFPKSAFYMYQSFWKDQPVIHIEPHWNWPADSIGKNIDVMVISNVDRVKLIVNGELQGDTVVDKYNFNTWKVPYHPGKLEAISYKNGKMVAQTVVETTGEASTLQLIPDRGSIAGDGWDAMPATVCVTDKDGRPIPVADNLIKFSISENGRIIGVGNGDPNCHEADKSYQRSLFHGLAQVIIQSVEGNELPITLTATASGLKAATIEIPVHKSTTTPFVEPVLATINPDKWLLSPTFRQRPDPSQMIADNDMNSWEPVGIGQTVSLPSAKYIIYRTTFTPYKKQQKDGGKIVFHKLSGKAEIWMNGQLLGKKENAGISDFSVNFLSPGTSCQLNILMEGSAGKAGLSGVVSIE